VGDVAEDLVVEDEWHAESDRGRGDPAVRGVGALGERVAARFAVGAELGLHEDEFGSCVDDLRSLHLGFESQHAGVAQPRRSAP
jgi:hypothetical protein